jgi:AbrB family looped-hinge helix DNA binding protein
VIPAKARKIFDIKPGDSLVVLGDEGTGIAIMKSSGFLDMADKIRKGMK